MKCPVDGATLAMTERQGVEVDYCPECRGLWLDRGELDKIFERTAGMPSGSGDHDDRHNGRDTHQQKGRKGRFSVLADILGGGDD